MFVREDDSQNHSFQDGQESFGLGNNNSHSQSLTGVDINHSNTRQKDSCTGKAISRSGRRKKIEEKRQKQKTSD